MSKKGSYDKTVDEVMGHKYRIFPRFRDYFRFVKDYLIVEPLIANSPLYSKMIAWVLQNKSPIFFEPTKEYERLTYTGCYNISPAPVRVGRYQNDAIYTLFILHEIAHQMFRYDRRVSSLDTEDFDRNMSLMERISSNITEVLVYRDIPGLRAKTKPVLPLIWYDLMKGQGLEIDKMSVHTLEKVREAWLRCEHLDEFLAPHPKDEPVRQYMANFRNGNQDFLAKRLNRLKKLPKMPQVNFPDLSPYDYMQDLVSYKPRNLTSAEAQKQYMWNTLQNVQLMYLLMGRTDYPKRFKDIFKRLDEMDDFILLDPAGDE